MNDENISTNGDWRLQGQEEFLQGVQLYWRHYARYSENWDHDHCEFCGVKFMVEDYPDVLHQWYSTEDQYYWVCKDRFEDFKERFHWEVANSRGDESGSAS